MGDFILCNGLDEPRAVKNHVTKLPWNPPTHGIIKINVDAAVNSSSDFIGVGAVARDEFGMVIAALSWRIFGKFSPQRPICRALESNVVADIREMLASNDCGCIRYASRDGNAIAHFFANYAISCFFDCIWIDSLPNRLRLL
ncbi:hypothetical protein TIFTF001_056295 [Ficus carica]|uniref:RNase H type-1 domain-containing protein n=1 Tax=Ficus carica TaxID=3494 RepID=A0AA88JJW5_FICCA|nr:hypothetical protein TIFTF001_056295 [Ficus carica]